MKKKLVLTVLSVALVAALAVGGTLAYLTAKTQTVTNTFTVGNITMSLDETQTDSSGTAVTPAAKTTTGNSYLLVPGNTYTKDPTVHVDANSEDCWVFVHVTNGIADIEDTSSTIAAQITTNGWTPVAGQDGYYYKDVAKATSTTDLPVFSSFKVDGNVDATTLGTYASANITVTACAVQKAGNDDVATAFGNIPATYNF